MVERGGVDCVTMDRVAEMAGVGKGTVFRRFESRAGLMAALVNALELDWQEAVISGPAPLGPGAPPLERLLAMGRSRMDLNLTHAELMDAAGWQKTHGHAAYAFIVMHVRHLLAELEVDGDLQFLASALVAPLNALVLRQLIDFDGASREHIFDGWTDLVGRVIG